MEQSDWTLNVYMDKSASPAGLITFSASIRNKGARVFHVSEFRKQADWQKGVSYYKQCAIRVNPDEEKELPKGQIKVPVRIALGSHTIKFGVTLSILTEKGWEDEGVSWGDKENIINIVKAQPMNYTLFISHSNNPSDKSILDELSEMFTNCGIDVFIAEERKQAGEDLWNKIRGGIDQSNCVLILWTESGSLSGDVREEIGYAIAKGKTVVPFAETGLQGSIKGIEYVKLDRNDIETALEEIGERILDLAKDSTRK